MTVRFSVHHLGLVVDDLDLAEGFYTDAFGFASAGRTEWTTIAGRPLGIDAPLAELRWSFLTLGQARIELHEYRGLPRSATRCRTQDLGLGHLAFDVDDMAGAVSRLEDAGVAFFTAPNLLTDSPGQEGDSWVYGRDPFGLTIELYASAQPGDRKEHTLTTKGISK